MNEQYAVVFPGQGAQYVGMGKPLLDEFALAREVFDEASESLGWDIQKLVLEDPDGILDLTQYTQPALLTVSVAVWRVFADAVEADPTYVAGLSLGEYSALVAAASLSLSDAVRLVHLRGQYMQEAVPEGVGGMAAVIGLEGSVVEAICDGLSTACAHVTAANLNCPGQVVISGHAGAVARASERAKEMGARKAVTLPVSAPFHSALMEPARVRLEEAMDGVSFADARFPVVSNVSGTPLTDAGSIRQGLLEQMTSPVRWEDSVRYILGRGVDTLVELGPKNTLTAFMRRIDRNAKALAAEDPQGIRQVVAAL